jgi:hypothetical protein
MAICRYCGQNAGWFRDVHEKCEQDAILEEEVRRDEAWFQKHKDRIEKLFEIAERKIFIDEYGDENWNGAFQEQGKFFLKAAELDRESASSRASIKKAFNQKGTVNISGLPGRYRSRYNLMVIRFFYYHKAQKARLAEVDFNKQSGTEFETYLAAVLKQEGFADISGTPKTGDQGADLIAKKNGRKIAIQAKRYKGSVGNEAVQEVAAAVKFYGADEGWVITSGTFTPSAKALAHRNGVRLIDGVALKNRNFA